MSSEKKTHSAARFILPVILAGIVVAVAGYGVSRPDRGKAAVSVAAANPPAEAQKSSVKADQADTPKTLREAYPDYKPEERDPEHESVLKGRRDVPVNNAVDLTEGGSTSIQTLIEQTAFAVDLGDYKTWTRLTVTRPDFENLLWPEFPQSRPAANIPASEAWDFVNTRNAGGFSKARGLFEAKGIQLKSFRVGTVETFTNFTLHRNVEVDITDATGAEFDLPLIRTIVERHGRFKIYSTGD